MGFWNRKRYRGKESKTGQRDRGGKKVRHGNFLKRGEKKN